VIRWLKERCNGNDTPKSIKPWYHKFKGEIKVEVKTYNEPVVIEGDDEDMLRNENVSTPIGEQTDEDKAIIEHAMESKLRMKTFGSFEVTGLHKSGPIIRITEIPVRTWIHDYRKWIQKLVAVKGKNRAILDFKDNSTTESPNFLIHWNDSYRQANHQSLHLTKSFGMSNITLIDHNGFPFKYNNIKEVMDVFYENMLNHYNLVVDTRISNEQKRLDDINTKIKFTEMVIAKSLVIIDIPEIEIRTKMEAQAIPFEYYEKSKSRDFSKESLEKQYRLQSDIKENLTKVEKYGGVDLWLDDLNRLEKVLKRNFKN